MKTEIKTIQEIIDGADCPLPIEIIPNYMGVNLCSVEAISWTRQDDNQLVNLTIHFTPNNETFNTKRNEVAKTILHQSRD